jgi:hypothetical protein
MTRDDLRDLIEATADEDGVVTREGVVAAAEADPDHPLRADKNFLWGNDTAAAREWRLTYAGRLIRSVPVVTRKVLRRRSRVPYFIRNPDDESKAGHVPLQKIAPSSFHAAIVALDEMRRVVGILRRTAAVVGVLQLDEVAEGVGQLLRAAESLEVQLRPTPVMASAARTT